MNPLAVALWLALAGVAFAQDAAIVAVAALTDPAKLATLQGERAANPRVLKRYIGSTMPPLAALRPIRSDDAQWLNHSAGTPRAPLVKASLLRNLDIADKLGLLTPENLALIRRGHSPLVMRGPYTGEPAEVDHIIPLAIAPEVDKEIANLELLPRSVNRRKAQRSVIDNSITPAASTLPGCSTTLR